MSIPINYKNYFYFKTRNFNVLHKTIEIYKKFLYTHLRRM